MFLLDDARHQFAMILQTYNRNANAASEVIIRKFNPEVKSYIPQWNGNSIRKLNRNWWTVGGTALVTR